jgi:hypothetical protein
VVAAMVDNNLEDALRALERARVEKQRELVDLETNIANIQRLVGVVPEARAAVSLEYQGLGPVEAAERYLTEVGKPLTTRDIVDGMAERGWTTRSRNAVATVYATLTNAKKKFRRNRDGQWELVG